MPESKYVVDQLLPRNTVNILCGAGGSGAERLFLQLYRDYSRGESDTLLGFRRQVNRPVYPCCYVSLSRPLDDVLESAADIGADDVEAFLALDPHHITGIRNGSESADKRTVDQIVDAVSLFEALPREAELIFIEGASFLVSSIMDYQVVSRQMRELARLCSRYKKTLFLLLPAAKNYSARQNEQPRERVLGSAAWRESARTIAFCDFTAPNDPEDDGRRLFITFRDSPMVYVREFLIDADGEMHWTETSTAATAFGQLDAQVLALGMEFRVRQLIGLHICSREHVQRWTKTRVREGRLYRSARGVYRMSRQWREELGIPEPPPPPTFVAQPPPPPPPPPQPVQAAPVQPDSTPEDDEPGGEECPAYPEGYEQMLLEDAEDGYVPLTHGDFQTSPPKECPPPPQWVM